jgi:Bax protein
MLLKDVFPSDDLDLLEASLRDKLSRLAAAGALGAGILGGGYGAYKLANQPPIQTRFEKPISVPSAEPENIYFPPDTPYDEFHRDIDKKPGQQGTDVAAPKKISIGGQPHGNFPPELVDQQTADRTKKVLAFKSALKPLITQINHDIMIERQQISKILDPKHKLVPSDQELVNDLADKYQVAKTKDNKTKTVHELARELLYKVDLIPEQLILAQAALESGWGLARQANNFFGHRATAKHTNDQKITSTDGADYRFYPSLYHSIRSYVHNLNTHRAYQNFREVRANLQRQKNISPELIALGLTKHLGAYSTNSLYGDELRKIMKTMKNVKK